MLSITHHTRKRPSTSPRTTHGPQWLEHLPPSQIQNWDDLVRTFVGNFQGTYVRLGNSRDLRACTQKPGESLQDFI
jgi:hypothetical protein